MRLPTGLPNNVILRTWMDNTRNNDTRVHSTSFVSPILWKQTSDSTPHVVTLNLRPFRTTNLSLDSFMASHCPRRNCGNRQKFMLKPLEQKNVCGSIQSEYGCNSPNPFSTVQNRLQDIDQPVRPSSNCSQTREVSASVVTLGAYESTKQYHGIVPDTGGACTLRNNSFRPSTKLSQATGQKIQIGNTFGFKSGYFNLLQQSDIVARGKPVLTQKNEEQMIKPVQSRWKCKNEQVNEKVFKYVDPVVGASTSYQERLAEITQHELDTIKWERTKKGRKKTVSSS